MIRNVSRPDGVGENRETTETSDDLETKVVSIVKAADSPDTVSTLTSAGGSGHDRVDTVGVSIQGTQTPNFWSHNNPTWTYAPLGESSAKTEVADDTSDYGFVTVDSSLGQVVAQFQGKVGDVPPFPAEPKDWLDAATAFSAGMSDAITGGLTKKVRVAMGTDDAVNTKLGAYTYGTYAGTAVGTALTFVSPCGAVALAKYGVKGLNAINGVAGVVDAGISAYNGNYATAGLQLLGSIPSFLGALRKCFVGGTPIQCEFGPKVIDELRAGDMVWSVPEDKPTATPQLQRVTQVFVRHAQIVWLQIGSVRLGTTAEHPFWVSGKGRVDAHLLMPGDRLVGQDGRECVVREVDVSADWATVYNFEVAEWHTYFVGCAEWGFDVWVHNYDNLNNNAAKSTFGVYEISINGALYKIGKADMSRITKSTGLPTRLHQQLRKLGDVFGRENVSHVITPLGKMTTAEAKVAEAARLQAVFDKSGWALLGNWKSFRPKLTKRGT